MTGRLRAELRRARRRTRRWLLRARLDLDERRRGERDPLLPPRRLNLPSQGPAVGERMVELMQAHACLAPSSRVLDAGCGPGRMAAPLTRFLDPTAGSYEGFDVMPRSVKWCRRRITPRHPNFSFQLADLRNAQYNPDGRYRASEYVFPYPDEDFDVAIAFSLFTHLRPFEGRRYLSETARVLRPGGRLISTWFLLTPEAEQLVSAGRARRPGMFAEAQPTLQLDHTFNDAAGFAFRSHHPTVPEHMIVIDRDLVQDLHERAGLRIVESIDGTWPGREPGAADAGLQDVIISERA